MTKKVPVINHVWFWLMVIPIVAALATGRMQDVTTAGFDSAAGAVELALKLIGVMTLWLGFTQIAEKAGLMSMIARALKPLMKRLFPDVPENHPALGAMVMNFAANMLGLGNAATPLGIKAMMELNRLNTVPGQATNAMILFLAINTSSIAILPLGVIGVRAAAGSSNPGDILVPGLLATICSTAVALTVGLLLNRHRPDIPASVEQSADITRRDSEPGTAASECLCPDTETQADADVSSLSRQSRIGPLIVLCLVAGAITYRLVTGPVSGIGDEIIKWWLIPLIMLALVVFGYRRGVNVYEAACEGGKEGFTTAVRIIPYLVMILVAIGMFRASGAFELMTGILDPVTSLVGMPPDVIGMALLRPLTGSGAFAVFSELTANAPDSFPAYMAGVMQGSTETTFYVLAVYFGSVGITRIRHALAPALMADAAGVAAAVFFSHLFFG